jgi:alkylation response protein AidB-like acyl-CoA dehydrogenase
MRPAGTLEMALVSVRLGLTRRMLEAAARHLAGRSSDGAPLTARQLVRAAIADVAAAIETCRHGLEVCGPESAAWLNARLDHADRTIVDLFGAAGYLRDHPVRCLHVVALLRDAWES